MWTLRARSACYPRSTFYPLSDGRSTPGRRITEPAFAPARHVRLAVKPASTLALSGRLPTVLSSGEPTRASVTLWEATARDPKLPAWHGLGAPDRRRAFGGRQLRRGQYSKGAYPEGLAPGLSRLLPVHLHAVQMPMPSCSVEGSRGAFPSFRGGVRQSFTNSTISPGPWFRQRPSRYAVRAGRNSAPDEEFRYLRTVIVTAAVYRGLGSPLRLVG